jgi:hypothetical protein
MSDTKHSTNMNREQSTLFSDHWKKTTTFADGNPGSVFFQAQSQDYTGK